MQTLERSLCFLSPRSWRPNLCLSPSLLRSPYRPSSYPSSPDKSVILDTDLNSHRQIKPHPPSPPSFIECCGDHRTEEHFQECRKYVILDRHDKVSAPDGPKDFTAIRERPLRSSGHQNPYFLHPFVIEISSIRTALVSSFNYSV